MSSIPSLKFSAKLVCIQALLKHLDEPDSDSLSEYITSLLETDCFTAVSEDILHRITKYFPEQLSNRLLKALLPVHVKELNLTSCHHVTLMGLVAVLKKCTHLQKLNLCGCTQLMVPDIFTCMGLMGLQITTISVEGNQNVTDEIVQTMIKFLPSLQTLDISSCNKVTDDVFLIEKEIQLRRETSRQPLSGVLSQYKYKLSNVDISGCGGITAVAVRHLTSLCGPFLRFVSISFTNIDSSALFSLAGFPAVIDFVLNRNHEFEKESGLKEYLSDLKEIAAVYKIPVANNGDGEVGENETYRDITTQTGGSSHTESNGETSDSITQNTRQEESANEAVNLENSNHRYETGNSKHDTHVPGTHEAEEKETLHYDTDVMECPGASVCDVDTVSKSEIDLENNSEMIGKMESLSFKKSGTGDNRNTVLSECATFQSRESGSNEREVTGLHNVNDDAMNKNQNGQDLTDFARFHSLKRHQSEMSTLINDNLTAETGFEGKDDSDLINTSHNDLNINVCDTKDGILNIDFGDVNDKKLPQAPAKPCLSSDNAKSFDVLEDSEHHLRPDIAEETPFEDDEKENHDSHSENADYDFAINAVEDCNQVDNYEDSVQRQEIIAENIPSEHSSANDDEDDDDDSSTVSTEDEHSDFQECIEDHEYLGNNKIDETNFLKQGICEQTDEKCQECEECNSIREKIKASKSAEGGFSETVDKSLGRSASDTCANLKKDNSKGNGDLKRSEAILGRSEKTVDADFTTDEMDKEESRDEYIDSVSNKLTDIEHKLDSIDAKLNAFRQKDEQTVQLYTPHLTGLNIESIKFPSTVLGKLCLEKFFQMNKELRSFQTNWKGISEDLIKTLLPSLSNLQEVSVEECTWLQSGGIAAIGKACPSLRSVNLRGVVFIKDMAMAPYLFLPNLTSLDLAECEVTDSTLIRLANRCCERLTCLDLSWCEEITEKGINEICCKCSKLEVLTLKKCPVSDITLGLMAENCSQLRELTIESVEDVTENTLSDVGISEIGQNLRCLQKLDISWNLSITNISINVIMSQCVLLEEAYMKGLKQITGQAFLSIIADYPKWQRCQALLKFKKREAEILEETGQEQCSSDEEYESLMIPHRSTSYAPNLRVLDLEYSDLVEDEHMMEIVSVCRGSLKVIDYYGQELKARHFIKK